MVENDNVLTLFTTRIRQMILQYDKLKKENDELYAMVDSREEDIKRLDARLKQLQRDYESLKMAKMMEICDADIEAAKHRIAGLIREVNKCITLLGDKE